MALLKVLWLRGFFFEFEMSESTDIRGFNFLLLLLCLRLSLVFGFSCPNIGESYHNDYAKFASFNSQINDAKAPEFRSIELNVNSERSSFDKELLRAAKKWLTHRHEFPSFNDISKTRKVAKTIQNVVLDSYQRNFDLMYSRGSNYSEIFQDPEPKKKILVPLTRTFKKYDFSSFPNLDEIYEYLDRLEKLGKGRAKVFPLKFHNGSWNSVRTNFRNEILSIRISSRMFHEVQAENPIIVVVAGSLLQRSVIHTSTSIHGRDWYAVQSAIFLATKLINDRNRTSQEDFDWWIVPVLNPDGYELSRMREKWRNWEKNLHGARSFESLECFGLDLDLSFEYQWLDCAADPCDFNYPGDVPFLAPEAQGLRDTLEAFSDRLDAFVALKEGKQMLVYPFSDTLQSPRNVRNFEKISKKAVKAFGKYVEGLYEHGQSSCLLNISAGFIEDWAKVHLGVEKSFAFYLGPTVKDRRDLKSQHLESHMRGTFDLINVIARGRIRDPKNSASKMCFSLVFFVINISILRLLKKM